MKYWEIKNDLIVFKHSDREIYLNARDLYKINEKLTYNNKDYTSPFLELNIRKSILGLNVLLEFKYEDGEILIELYAIKKSKKYKISINNGEFADYIIIDGVWHYLSTNYNEYIEIIKNENIKINEKLSFIQYMKLIRNLNKQGYEYVDNVNTKIDLLKNEETRFSIEGLNTTLFNYQEKGCKWLEFMMDNNCRMHIRR